MLFNSFEFILLFFPATLAGYFLLGRRAPDAAAAWLCAASLFFYAWWDVSYLPLLLGSIAFNFWAGLRICASEGARRKHWLVFAIAADLALLGYFKYADFFVGSVNALAGTTLPLPQVLLPIGISFFTFTQIAYLVDAYKGWVKEFRPIHYALFVTYFPHLIAGPVLHHAEMIPQFARRETYRPDWDGIAIGASLFILGLAKKILLADNFSPFVGPVFDADDAPTLIEAWGAALAYTFQLYFDFSGYSDMAVGLSRIVGVKLPINFNSPYKSANVIEFWRRWHMTLSRFLRDYLYIALGGNRHGTLMRYRNLLLTMVLGGLWHGAAWNFVFWGLLHGIYLAANHGWGHVKNHRLAALALDRRLSYRIACQALCLLAVVVAWVFFRAHTFERALAVLAGMAGLNGLSLPTSLAAALAQFGLTVEAGTGRFEWPLEAAFLAAGAVICLALPNSMEIVEGQTQAADGTLARLLRWRPTPWHAVAFALLGLACVLNLTRAGEFLYFQF